MCVLSPLSAGNSAQISTSMHNTFKTYQSLAIYELMFSNDVYVENDASSDNTDDRVNICFGSIFQLHV